jgi:glycosyltransferase involved in cell wall biosynthesis
MPASVADSTTGSALSFDSARRPRVLFISTFLLFPESRVGGAKRLYYLAREIERYCDLSVLCTDVSLEAEGRAEPVKTPFPRFCHIRYQRKLVDKLGSPLGVARSLRPQEEAVNTFVGPEPYDAVICAFPHSLSFLELPILRAVKEVIYIEDDLSLETARVRLAATTSPVLKLLRALRLAQSEAWYRRMMRRVGCFISISEEEQAIVREKYPSLKTRLVGYGLPIDQYAVVPPPPRPRVLGFIGHYSHQPNVDAVHFFLESWYPLLKQRLPGITMHIAGKEIPQDIIEKYRADSSVVWREDVPQLRSFYEEISIFVNPIVSQRGLRTKLVEAAAFGRPIISTALGAEGLAELDIALCETAEEAVAACLALDDPESCRRQSLGNRQVVENRFSLEAVGRALLEAVTESAQSKPSPASPR